MKTKFIIFLVCTILINSPVLLSQSNEVNSPIKNFEKLWKEFDERYANFELKEVNWNAVYKKYRPQINSKTTNESLYKICCEMLQELNDGHVSLYPNFENEDIECGPPYDFLIDLLIDSKDKAIAFKNGMNAEFARLGFSDPVHFNLSEDTGFQYRISDSLGYLRLDEMTEKRTFGKFNKALHQSFESFQDKQGLIIDLRFNGGGWDYHSYCIAAMLIEKNKTLTHYKRTRNKGKSTYSKMKTITVKSSGKFQFTKPVVILTSDYTASASEVFLILIKDLPYVSIIGDKTEGIFSDKYEFELPNDWDVSLSNQEFFNHDKKNFEGVGIMPDIKVLNSEQDIETQGDAVLKTGVDFLTNQ